MMQIHPFPVATLSGPLTHVPLSTVSPLLPNFELKYPGGWSWLERRLGDAETGRARIWLAFLSDKLAALAIETPKGCRRSKLSTFAVEASFRGRGMGTGLLHALKRDWLERDLSDVHVTVDQDDPSTTAFFLINGFSLEQTQGIAYGERRVDRLLTWSASTEAVGDGCAVAFH